jgi:type VI secretion system protein ImpF
MAGLTGKQRLQPALLDRLTDSEPHLLTEPRENRMLSMRQLRQSLLCDVSNLLNAVTVYDDSHLSAYPRIYRSVLAFGLADLTGSTLSSLDPSDVAGRIAKAILWFEPRIIGSSLNVSPVPVSVRSRRNAMAFLVEGDLWAQPYPERLCFRTEVDLEMGVVSVAGSVEGELQ